jgi:NADPH-dependent curcumin reductase CurA
MPDTVQTNQQIRLASRPVGLPTDANWQFTDEQLAPLEDGQVRVKVLYLSLDPAMRGCMN